MINLAELYADGGAEDKQKAIGIYKSLLKNKDYKPKRLQGPEVFLYNISWLYMQLGNFSESRKYFKDLIIKYPDTEFAPQSYFMIGYTFFREGMRKMAELTFKEAIKTYEDTNKSIDSIIGLANLYEDMNQLENALKTYSLANKNIDEEDTLREVLEERIALLKNRLKKIKK